MRATGLALALTLALAAPLFAPAVAGARPLTVEDAVKMALAENPRLLGGEARARAARDVARSVRGRLLPSVRVVEEYQHYNQPFAVTFAIPSPVPPKPFTVRDQDTSTFVVSASQPLLGLLHLGEDYAAQSLGARAAEAQVEVGRAALREAIEGGFLRYFQARSVEQVAASSVRELDDQLAVARARLKAGVLTNADVLRVEVAAAGARQQQIVAHTQGEVARAQLFAALGLSPDDATVELEEPRALLELGAAEAPSFAPARDQALAHRAELTAYRLMADSATHQRRARLFSLLPEIDAEAAYVRIDGQVFAPKNSEYIGVKAQWAVWEWGAGFYQFRAAAEQARAAALDLELERHTIDAEVASQVALSTAAKSAVDLARRTIASAEEAYRVTNALVAAGAATTTDLLDAQSALTQARLNLERARYDQAIARVSLSRIMGR